MAKSCANVAIPASAARVWQVVRDFNGMPTWHPGTSFSEIEHGQSAAEVGCVRRLTLAGGGTMREQLVALDDVDRRYTYEYVEGPFPARNYRGTIRVRPITGIDHTFVEWYATYDADPADEAELDKALPGVFATGLQGLAGHFGG